MDNGWSMEYRRMLQHEYVLEGVPWGIDWAKVGEVQSYKCVEVSG